MLSLAYLRSFRIAEYAIFDFAASFIVMLIISPLLTKIFYRLRLDIPRKSWLAFTIPLSIPFHLLFGKMTPFTANFLNLYDHYLLKSLVVGLFLVGLWNIKIYEKHNIPSL